MFFSCLFGKDERFRTEFGNYPDSPQTRSKFIWFHFFRCHFLFFFFDKRNEFGVGLEILQTLSKLICFFKYKLFCFFFGKEE